MILDENDFIGRDEFIIKVGVWLKLMNKELKLN